MEAVARTRKKQEIRKAQSQWLLRKHPAVP
jgi:hypothetical protein